MRIVVTGALGHIGSALVRSLPRSFPGVEIVMVDDLSTQRYGSLFELPADGLYDFVEADILSADLERLVDGAHAVVHLAAITNAEQSFAAPEAVERVNVHGTELVARACGRTGVPIVFASTTSVYGTQAAVVDETCPPDQLVPQSPYATSKLRAERLLAELAERGSPALILRFGTIVGRSPGMRFHTAANKFCWQAAMGQPLTVWRTALHQLRPYLELSDAVRAIEFALARNVQRGLYNVVTANASVADIVACIREVIPDIQVTEIDSPVMNQLSYEVDASRFRSLGFDVRGGLRTAIRGTLDLLRGARRVKWPDLELPARR